MAIAPNTLVVARNGLLARYAAPLFTVQTGIGTTGYTNIPVVSSDSEWLAVCTNSFNVLIYDIETSDLLATLSVAGNPRDIVLSPDNTKIYISHEYYPRFTVYDISNIASPTVVAGTPIFAYASSAIDINHAGTLVAIGEWGQTLKVYNSSTWSVVQAIESEYSYNYVRFSPNDGKLVIGYTGAPYLRVYDTTTWTYTTPLSGTGNILGLSFSPTGDRLAITMSNSPYFAVYNTSDWSIVSGTNTLYSGAIKNIFWSGDGQYIAAATYTAPFVDVIKTSDWTRVSGIPSMAATDTKVTFSPSFYPTFGEVLFKGRRGTPLIAGSVVSPVDGWISAQGRRGRTLIKYVGALSVVGRRGAISIAAALTGNNYYVMREAVTLSSSATGQPTYRLLDVLSLVVSPSAGLELSKTLTETLSLSDALTFIAKLLASEGLTLTDGPTGSVTRVLLLAEALAISTGVSPTLELSKVLLEEMAFEEAVSAARNMTVKETMQLGDALTAAIEATLTARETLDLAAEIRAAFVMIASDSLEIGASLASTLEVVLRARDGIIFIGSLPLQDGDYQAWVMNADTTGTSSYTNFPMESLFTYKGVPYGLTSTGLYRLEGEDDDGTNIDAVVATGDLDLGTMIEKNATHAYLYLTQNGEVVLRTITSRQGTRTETYYQVLDRTTESDDDVSYRKVKLGMGVKGTWWRFELASVDGASFDLDGAEVRYVALTRRGSWR